MCILSGDINNISATKIFARHFIDTKGRDRQWLVYSMHLDTPNDVAMILPIPIKPGVGEDDIEFEDLSKSPDLFKDIEKLFPKPDTKGMKSMRGMSRDTFSLKVHTVGSFEASFSPSLDDMDRLDPRFRLPKNVWAELPEYADWGFVVFKLAKGDAERHPMSFCFTTRHTNKLFFPTVHIHHKKIEPFEEFDHVLYAQGVGSSPMWERSGSPVDAELRRQSKALTTMSVFKTTLEGELSNEDVYAGV